MQSSGYWSDIGTANTETLKDFSISLLIEMILNKWEVGRG